jgi:hypothetical protein
MTLKIAKINGDIPLIDSKDMKLRYFSWLKRKISAYLAPNKLHSEYKRKNSAYHSFAGHLRLYFMLNICHQAA